MIWVSICYVAYVGVSALQPMKCYEILLQLSHQQMELMYRGGFSPFLPPHTKTNGYFHQQKLFLNPNECCHYQFDSYRFGVTCFDDDNACSNNCRSKQGMILYKSSTRR